MVRNKLPATLVALGFVLNSSSVFAVAMSSMNNNTNVFLPDLKPGYEFSITALALKPGASNLNYVIYNKELPTQSPSWTEKELRPDYTGAFALAARYIFTEAKDVNLEWTHLNSSTNSTTVAPDSSYFLGPDYEIGPPGLPIRKAVGNVQFKYDVVNLDAGQFVNFGRRVAIRFFGGLSNTYLREEVNTTYSGNVQTGDYPGPFSTSQDVTANFTGIGPRVGLNGTYVTDYGLGFLGEAAVSALIGSSYSKTAYNSSAQELITVFGQNSNSQFIKDQNVTQVVPGIDAKLGLSYVYCYCNGMLLTLKAGYQAAVYVNAINQYLPGSLVEGAPMSSGGIFVATMHHTQSNYSVQGPFFEASLHL